MENKLTGWVLFDGSDEQIAELVNNTFIVNNINSIFGNPKCVNTFYTGKTEEEDKLWLRGHFHEYGITKYWLIPADPLREMKIRWATTGQPVWIRRKIENEYFYWLPTTTPDWNIPNAEYSFTPFEKEIKFKE